MGLRSGAIAAAAALLLLILAPAEAWAWGPSTHVLLGGRVLANLAALPGPLRDLLAACSYEFLYGNLSADITLAKRYVHASRHCHRWDMGFLLLERAETPRLKSFALGYLCHLAADTIAHNHFVPRQLLLTSSTPHLGHAYWEYRFDSHVAPEHLRLAREVVTRDHAAPDELLETVLTQAVFSFRTNKRLFQRMIHLSNDERWQKLFERVVAQSRWDLPEEEVERYLETTCAFVMDFLCRGSESRACSLDPIGAENLKVAKRIRRRTIRHSRVDSGKLLDLGRHSEEVAAIAELHFVLPAAPPPPGDSEELGGFWERFGGARAIAG
ncbi:MAG: zinc dependent phospholipase C family protein [Gemmatimonadota bacterium]